MNVSLMTAIKFRRGCHKSGLVSIISLISTLSIAIGIAALIIGLSAMNGFERELDNRVLSVVPNGLIYSQNGNMQNASAIQQQLAQNKHIVSTAPYVRFTGLVEKGNKLNVIEVQGLDLQLENKISQLPKFVLNHKWQTFTANQQQIIIGAGIAKSLSIQEGNFITLLIPDSQDKGQLKPPRRIRLQVHGILDLNGSLSNNLAILPLTDAQKLNHLGDNVTGLMVNVDDIYHANQIIHQAAFNLNYSVMFSSWESSYGFMYRDIQMIRQVMYLAMIVVISVACFNIVSTLVIAVKDKQREIAILKTLGANNSFIKRIFIYYGLISGLIGSILGIVLGVIVAWKLSAIVRIIESLMQYQFLNSHIYFIDFIPSEIHLFDVIVVFITAMLLSLIASYYPARRACKIEPVRILNSF